MKKIISITMVKNESDIIESFIRYGLNIFDEMIVLDNGSSDNTLEILNLLKKEGLNIQITKSDDMEYNQSKIMTELLNMAVQDYCADLIVPLDVDEFLISEDGNPRKNLEKLRNDTFYFIKWKTYIPCPNDDNEELFIPSRITHSRDEKLEMSKIIIPKELVLQYDVKLTTGNHNLYYDKKYAKQIKSEKLKNMKLAHFPVRSKDQIISKVLVGWLHMLAKDDYVKYEGSHWKKMFGVIVENKNVDKYLIGFAKQYSIKTDLYNKEDVLISNDPIDLSFCDNLSIKYCEKNTDYLLTNLINNYAFFSSKFLKLRENFQDREDFLNNKMNEMSLDFEKTIHKKEETIHKKEKIIHEKEEIIHKKNIKIEKNKHIIKKSLEEIDIYKNSFSWKITMPIRKIGRILRKVKKRCLFYKNNVLLENNIYE